MRKHSVNHLTSIILICIALFVCDEAHSGDRVTVFAAASTQAAIDGIAVKLKAEDIDIVGVYGASSSLARQIEHGAPADIYLSANTNWIDYLRNINKLEPDQLRIATRNRLVMVSGPVPFAAPRMLVGPGYPLDTVLQNARFAIGDPAHVPVGIYAKQALQNWGLWDDVKDRLAPARDATGALMLVARGEAKLGVVYISDLKRTDQVRVFAQIPEHLHAPIIYPMTIVKGKARPSVLKVMDYITSSEGQAAFRAAGFGTIE